MLSTKQSPALAPGEHYRPALAPERVRSCLQTGRMTSQSGWIQGQSFLSRPLLPLGATFPHRRWASAVPAPRYNQSLGAGSWMGFPLALEPGRSRDHALLARGVVMSQVRTPTPTPTAPLQHGVLHASSGLGGVRAPKEAAEGAVGNSLLGGQGFSAHLEGARSIACPRCKPPLSTARAWVSVPPSSRIHSQFPCHQWCRWSLDHLSVGILGLVPLAGCWQLLCPLCANLAASTGLGARSAGPLGDTASSYSGFGGLCSRPGKGRRCPWFGRRKVGKRNMAGPHWPDPPGTGSLSRLSSSSMSGGSRSPLAAAGSRQRGAAYQWLFSGQGWRAAQVRCVGSDPAGTRSQLLRRTVHSGRQPLPAGG